MGKSCSILIADDDPIYREVATAALMDAGFSVRSAADGTEAAVALACEPFELAIIDLNMPGRDGMELLRSTRAGGINVDCPLIVITGDDDAESIGQAFDAGATSFMTKPLNWALFTKHVEFVHRAGLTATELRESIAAARFLGDLKSTTMSTLASDFQGPTKQLFAFAKLFEEQAFGEFPDPTYQSLAADMARAALALNASLLRLMNLGDTLKSQIEIADDPVSLRKLLDDVIVSKREDANRRGIDIELRSSPTNSSTAKGDRVLLAQALKALLDNALHWAPSGSKIKVWSELDEDRNLVIRVADTGAALPPAMVAEINGTNIKVRPTFAPVVNRELQMGVAKVLAQAHQGRLEVVSSEDMGTRVSLVIPAERVVPGIEDRMRPAVRTAAVA